jgi:hypothetical protein
VEFKKHFGGGAQGGGRNDARKQVAELPADFPPLAGVL